MALANKERQEAFRQRMRASGYKRKEAWVRNGTDWSLWERLIQKTEEITAGWTGTRVAELFNGLIKAVEARKEEPGKKK
jgi:hypothetical protein